jgi:hypothetical protein
MYAQIKANYDIRKQVVIDDDPMSTPRRKEGRREGGGCIYYGNCFRGNV